MMEKFWVQTMVMVILHCEYIQWHRTVSLKQCLNGKYVHFTTIKINSPHSQNKRKNQDDLKKKKSPGCPSKIQI